MSWKATVSACAAITGRLSEIVLPGRRLTPLWVFAYRMPRGWRINRHRHSYTEMNLILSGQARDGRPPHQRLGPGCVFVNAPNQAHSWSSPWGVCRRLVVCFNAEPPVAITPPQCWPCWDHLLPVAEHILRLADDAPPGWEDRIHARLALLISEALTLGELEPALPALAASPRETLAQRVDAFLDDNYARAIRLRDVAAHLGVSLSTLTHHYPLLSGQTVGQRLITLRMEQAAYLLRETDRTLEDIAAAVGIGQAAYFCRQFKKHFRTTPTHYRSAGPPG